MGIRRCRREARAGRTESGSQTQSDVSTSDEHQIVIFDLDPRRACKVAQLLRPSHRLTGQSRLHFEILANVTQEAPGP
jgi:hypothetical protein